MFIHYSYFIAQIIKTLPHAVQSHIRNVLKIECGIFVRIKLIALFQCGKKTRKEVPKLHGFHLHATSRFLAQCRRRANGVRTIQIIDDELD